MSEPIGHVAAIVSSTRVRVYAVADLESYKATIERCLNEGGEVVVSWQGHYYQCRRRGRGYTRQEIPPDDPRTVYLPNGK